MTKRTVGCVALSAVALGFASIAGAASGDAGCLARYDTPSTFQLPGGLVSVWCQESDYSATNQVVQKNFYFGSAQVGPNIDDLPCSGSPHVPAGASALLCGPVLPQK